MGYVQDEGYTDLCDLYEPDFDIPPGGDPTRGPYKLHSSNVPCRFVTKSAVDQPDLVGLVEGEDLLTVDTVRLPEGSPVDSNWIMVNRTPAGDGAENQYYGKAWIARGEPRRRSSTRKRPSAGRTIAYVTKLALKPSGVP